MRPLRMSGGEQRATAALAVAALAAFAALWRPWEGGNRLTLFAFGIGFAAVLGGAAWWGNRFAAAFAASLVAVFGPWGSFYIVGAPYLVLAVWLAMRANGAARAAPLSQPSLDDAGRRRPSPRPAPGARRATSRGQSKKQGSSRRTGSARTPSGRVTPKRRGRT